MRRIASLLAVMAASPAYAGGMPQMDPTWFENGFVWLVITFTFLYVAIARYVVPTISGVLSERERAIGGAIAEAEKAKREAESTSGNVDQATMSARQRAAEIMGQTVAENNRDAAEAIAKLDHELNRKASQATAALEDALKKASDGVDAAISDLAQAMVAKLLGAEVATAAPAPKAKRTAKR